MTEPTQVSPPGGAPALLTPAVERRAGRWRAPLTVVGIVAVAFLAWQLLDTRSELRALQTDVARRLGEGDATNRETRLIARNGQDGAQSLQGRVASLETRIVDTESQQASLEKLYQEFSRTRDERGLQEIEQAVAIASQQLQLAGNVAAALSALQAADARLASMDQTRLLPLRRLIVRDIDRLKALPLADVGGISLQIEAMLGRIDTLPLAFEHSPLSLATAPAATPVGKQAPQKTAAKTAASKGRGAAAPVASAPAAVVEDPGFGSGLAALAGEFMSGFRELVHVERLDKPDEALLAPAKVSYLRENIRLRLLSARLALLQRDGRVFAEDTQQVRLLLERFFDTKERRVASLIEELRQMESARLVVELPQLTETETALRRLRLAR